MNNTKKKMDEDRLRALASTVKVVRVGDLAQRTLRRYPAWRRGYRDFRMALAASVLAALIAAVLIVTARPYGAGQVDVQSGPAAGGIVAPALHVGTVSGVDPLVLECPAVGTCYLTGNPPGTPCPGHSRDGLCRIIPSASAEASKGMEVTHDGGKTWLINGPFVSTNLTCVSADVCAGTYGTDGHSKFAETVDGGHTWTSRPMPGRYHNVLSCTTAQDCVSIESFTGKADVTSNAGLTWKPVNLPSGLTARPSPGQALPPGGFQPFALQCFKGGACRAIGNILNRSAHTSQGSVGSTVALYSNDGGYQWQRGTVPNGFSISTNLSCGTPADCMAVGSNGQIATDNGGRTWQPVANPGGAVSKKGFWWVACVGPSDCWMEASQDHGNSLGIVDTTNLGRSWNLLKAPSSIGPASTVACATPTACYATANKIQPPSKPKTPPTLPPQDNGGPVLFLSWN